MVQPSRTSMKYLTKIQDDRSLFISNCLGIFLYLAFTFGFRSSSGNHLLHNGLATGGFSYTSLAFLDWLVV